MYFPMWALFGYRVTCRNLRIFFRKSSLSDVISPDSFLMLNSICLFLCLVLCLGPFRASNVFVLIPFLFSMVLFYVSFSLIC